MKKGDKHAFSVQVFIFFGGGDSWKYIPLDENQDIESQIHYYNQFIHDHSYSAIQYTVFYCIVPGLHILLILFCFLPATHFYPLNRGNRRFWDENTRILGRIKKVVKLACWCSIFPQAKASKILWDCFAPYCNALYRTAMYCTH